MMRRKRLEMWCSLRKRTMRSRRVHHLSGPTWHHGKNPPRAAAMMRSGVMSRHTPAKVSGRGTRRRRARHLCPTAGNVRRRVPQQERQVGDALGVTGVRGAHQPAQQLLLEGLAEQAAPAGGERFVALLGDNLQVRCGDVGQREYSQDEAIAADSGPRVSEPAGQGLRNSKQVACQRGLGKRDRVNEFRAQALSA